MTFNLAHNGDLYEITLRGHVIGRITCYIAPFQSRQDVQYDDLSEDVQDQILDMVRKAIQEGDNS